MRYLIPMLVVLGLVTAPVALAQTDATRTMARILMHLNHFPSDADKAELAAIVDDEAAGEGERTVARALLNMQHQVSDDDRAALEALARDSAAAENLRTLAGVLADVNHAPTGAQKDELKPIATP
jgi:hypothetical protein